MTNVVMHGKTIFKKCISVEKWDVRLWTGFNWLRMRSSKGKPLGSVKGVGFLTNSATIGFLKKALHFGISFCELNLDS